MELLVLSGVDISHSRLVDLSQLADQARPFYDWVEEQFRAALSRSESLDVLLRTATESEIKKALWACYAPQQPAKVPLLFDGVGRSYPHNKACYYFFAWVIRDAPQQRLAPLIQRVMKASRKSRTETEVDVLASLICKYQVYVKTFIGEAVREVIIDRLEGSRRSIRGHEKEAIVRTALLTAIQDFFTHHESYGLYAGVEIAAGQVKVGNESYDVSANLLDPEKRCIRRILVPLKTRETEGGGHAHLFTRDIMSALNAAKYDNPNDFLIAVIVARNWSLREAVIIRDRVDHAAIFDLSPTEFSRFSEEEQVRLNEFIAAVLEGTISPKQAAG